MEGRRGGRLVLARWPLALTARNAEASPPARKDAGGAGRNPWEESKDRKCATQYDLGD